jgi:hypothetical protein
LSIRSWPEQENVTLSEHLILACLFEALISHSKYGASTAWLDEQRFAAITARIPPIGIAAWRWMGFRFFAGQGAFMCAGESFEAEGGNGCSVWIGAKTEHPVQFLKPYLDDDWDHIAV